MNQQKTQRIVTPKEIQKVYQILKSQGKDNFTREEFFKVLDGGLNEQANDC